MAMAPGLQRRGGLFGSAPMQPPYNTPGIGDGMTATAAPMAPKKGFDWGKLIGVLGDSLSIAGGGQAQFVPNMIDQRNRRQAQAYAEQTYQRRRGDEMTDWQAKQEYERANPSPRAPHYWETNDGSLGMVGPDGKPSILYQDPNDKIQWMQVDNGDGTKTVVPYNSKGPLGQQPQAPPQAQGAPQRPVGKLKPYGGQTATPSGNF